VCGVSSFAFQGTNAHGIVGGSLASAPKSAVAAGDLGGRHASLLDRKAIWCSVQPPPLLTQFLGAGSGSGGVQTAVMLADLSLPTHVSLAAQYTCLGHRMVGWDPKPSPDPVSALYLEPRAPGPNPHPPGPCPWPPVLALDLASALPLVESHLIG
jgi:hypothetical protein